MILSRRIVSVILVLVMMALPAYAVTIPNSASNPDTTGFIVQKVNDTVVISNYTDPVVIVHYKIINTVRHPYILKDSSDNYINTFPFNNSSVSNVISVENASGGWVMTVNTSENITDPALVPAGVPQSISGVWHRAIVSFPNADLTIVFWVVDTTTAGDYDTVVVDIGGDKVDMQKFTVYDVKDMTVPDDFNSKMRIQILFINQTGDTIKVRNLFDVLKVNDTSPYDGSKLQPVLMPHYVKAVINVSNIKNIQDVKLVKVENGSYVEYNLTGSNYDPFTNITYDANNSTITIVTLLGDFTSGSIHVPGIKDFYFALHLKPIVKVSNITLIDDNTYSFKIILNNTNNVDLGPGEVVVPNVAPASAVEQVNNSLSFVPSDIVSGYAEVKNMSTAIIVNYNASVPAGSVKTIVVTYKYTDPLTAKVNEILDYLKAINTTAGDNNAKLKALAQAIVNINDKIDQILSIVNSTNGTPVSVNLSEVINKLDEIISMGNTSMNNQDAMMKSLANITSELVKIENMINSGVNINMTKIDDIEQIVKSNNDTLNAILTILQNQGNDQSDVQVAPLISDYIQFVVAYTNYLDNMITKFNSTFTANNITDDRLDRLVTIKGQLNNVVNAMSQIDNQGNFDSKIVVLMTYLHETTELMDEANTIIASINNKLEQNGVVTSDMIQNLSKEVKDVKNLVTMINTKLTTMGKSENNANTTGANTTGATGNTSAKKNMMIPLIGGIVLILLAGLLIIKKKNAEGEEEEEEEEEEFEEEEEEEEEF